MMKQIDLFSKEFSHKNRGCFKYKKCSINEKINVKSRLKHDNFFSYLFEFAEINGYYELIDMPYTSQLHYPHYPLGTKFN